jgi:L-aminoadipate-semialdehyde dehydrogenase
MRAFLQTKLPAYSIPSIFCPLAKMPLTPNGKIDKNKLPLVSLPATRTREKKLKPYFVLIT